MIRLYERLGGQPVLARVVVDLYDRLGRDPRVMHHFDPERLPSLITDQQRWLTAALGGPSSGPAVDLAEVHRHLGITDEQVAVVIGHLDASMTGAGIDDEIRRQVISVISRLWYARRF